MKYVTDSYREGNLRKLADGLSKLPEDYTKFTMADFVVDNGGWNDGFKYTSTLCALLDMHKCGTSGCAVGHGPLLGIGVEEFNDCEGAWGTYCQKVLINRVVDEEAWDWCFSSDWTHVDNTPHGAARRILWLLDKGLPEYWEEQMCGVEQLCYI